MATARYINEVKTVRSAVSSSDASNPTIGSGKDFRTSKYIEVSVNLTGTTPTANVTPLLSNSAGDAYMEGETINVVGAKSFVYKLEVNGNEDVNFRIDAISGTTPAVTIKARGVN